MTSDPTDFDLFEVEYQARKSEEWQPLGSFESYRAAYANMMHRAEEQGAQTRQVRIVHAGVIKAVVKPVPSPRVKPAS